MSYGLVTRSQEHGQDADPAGRRLLDYLDEDDREAVLAAACPVLFARGD